jgi:hypothetical protein
VPGSCANRLACYSSYYNETRTHLGLEKDAPLGRAIRRCGARSSPHQFFPDCTIATRGYDFREQATVAHGTGELRGAADLSLHPVEDALTTRWLSLVKDKDALVATAPLDSNAP